MEQYKPSKEELLAQVTYEISSAGNQLKQMNEAISELVEHKLIDQDDVERVQKLAHARAKKCVDACLEKLTAAERQKK